MKMNQENINSKDLIIEMHRHSYSIYDAELDINLENEKIVNWLFGLTTGGLVFASSRIDSENISKIKIILILIFISFALLMFATLFYKMFSRATKKSIHNIKFNYDLMKLKLLNYSNQIEEDLKNETIFKMYYKFLDGIYEIGSSKNDFKNEVVTYNNANRIAAFFYWSIVILFLTQYLLIFILVLKSI